MTKTATAPTVSVVLPTYEERENIGPLIEGVARHVDQLAEIIVVDDDSPDLTWQRVAELQRRYAQLRLIRREGIRGLTTAIQAGIAAATGDVLVWMDCDLSMGPEVIPSLVAEIRRGYDVAVASRYVPGGADVRDVVLHRQLSRVICTVARLVLVPSFRDYTSGFIAIRREVLQDVPLRGDYGEYFIDLIFNSYRLGYSVIEVPYTLVSRTSGVSKTATNPFGFAMRGRKYLQTILRLRLQTMVRPPRAPKNGAQR